MKNMETKNKKWIILFLVCALVSVIGVKTGLVTKFLSNSDNSNSKKLNYVLYIKDESLYYMPTKSEKATKLADHKVNDTNLDKKWELYFLGSQTFLSKNQKRLFFSENTDTDRETNVFYYVDVDDNGDLSERVKIADNVKSFKASYDGKFIAFIQKQEKQQLVHLMIDENKSEVVDYDVRDFEISSDGKKLVYTKESPKMLSVTLLEKEFGNSKEEISENCRYLGLGNFFDNGIIYYSISFDEESSIDMWGELYKKKVGETPEKIDDNVVRVAKIYKTGEIYYSKAKDSVETIDLKDIVVDDTKKEDEITLSQNSKKRLEQIAFECENALKEHNSEEERIVATKKWEENQIKLRAYNEAEARTMLRQFINSGEKINIKMKEYYYYDNNNSTKIGESLFTLDYFMNGKKEKVTYIGEEAYNVDGSDPAYVLNSFDRQKISKVNMSDLREEYWRNLIAEAVFARSFKPCIAVRKNIFDMDSKMLETTGQVMWCHYSEKFPDKMYLRTLPRRDRKGSHGEDLSEITLKDGKVIDCKKLTAEKKVDEILGEYVYMMENGDFYYEKRIHDDESAIKAIYEIWNKGKLFSEGMIFFANEKENEILLIKPTEKGDEHVGPLEYYKDGVNKKIGEKVASSAYILPNKDIVYLENYDSEKQIGDLYIYTTKDEKKLIEKDVKLINVEKMREGL